MTLHLEPWRDVASHCGQAVPGVGRHNPRVMDLSQRDTTEDQQRIEAVLDTLVGPHDRILHVGVGNSSLALRFASRVDAIFGITLSGDELALANSLGITNYRAELINKYAPELAAIPGDFSIIIDNNPASFCCCVAHFEGMLGAYAALLRPGGIMLTDREGMYWCYDNGPMRLRYEDLQTIARHYPFDAERLTSHVFALRRRAG